MTQRINRVRRLETASKPAAGLLPILVTMPRDATPAERAAIRADVARREAEGQPILLVSWDTDPLAALVEACGP